MERSSTFCSTRRTLPVFERHTWTVDPKGYVVRNEGTHPDRTTVKLHRELLGLHPGDGVEGDHRDGEKLNNTRANLRVATHAENVRNRGRFKNNTSGYKGVSWNKQNRKWFASI
ncbi:hypothetical protein WJX72_009520 [[Myrmecia] bisecta]|uniref:HNH nuclease domain-containing protein n=1 Tax=[Myrmecia] bisecta TaxID=41462 RepID=A0AAW1Q6Y8_9CHLO